MAFVDKKKNIEYHQMYPFRALSDWNMTWCVCVCSLQQRCVLEWAASAIPTTSPASLTFWNTVSNKPQRIKPFSLKRKFSSLFGRRLILPQILLLFFFYHLSSQVLSVLFILPTNQKWASVSVQHKTPHMLRLSGFGEGKTLYLMHSRSYFVVLNYLVYPVFLNLFCLLHLQLIISDISQNILQRATKNKQRTCCIKPFFRSVALFFRNAAYHVNCIPLYWSYCGVEKLLNMSHLPITVTRC